MSKIKSKLWSNKRRKIATTLTTFAVMGAAAFAAWVIVGNGQGSGHIGGFTAPQITPGTPVGNMYPGQDGDASLHVNNQGGPLFITVTAPNSAIGTGTCYNFVTVNPSNTLHIPVPVGQSDVIIPGAFHLSDTAPQSCAGTDFTRSIDVTFSTQ
jgi:hypothetical protein